MFLMVARKIKLYKSFTEHQLTTALARGKVYVSVLKPAQAVTVAARNTSGSQTVKLISFRLHLA